MYYGPLFMSLSEMGTIASSWGSCIVGGYNLACAIVACFLLRDCVGRRALMMMGVFLMVAAQIMLSIAFMPVGFGNQYIWKILGFTLFIAGFELGPGCLFWLFIHELFPEAHKAKSATIANVFQWGFNLVVSALFPFLLAFKFFMTGSLLSLLVTVVCGCLLFWNLPDTEGYSHYQEDINK
eukprot:TRINITY_DN12016_c0_g1_i1.p1 TRINITY_DN12016_c0_g1~~TRINITY_DN12016_c0_g1_i1.p1  ORF type:complete len:181 (-),score=21.23 TRINITY_DN12016_c0_g1_i1:555-1097(-)